MTKKKKPLSITFEGGDGGGKYTQMELLAGHLKREGFNVQLFDFPQYHSFIGNEIGRRLNGTAPMSANVLPPQDMSLWYAVDRMLAFQTLSKEADILLLNRSTYSNIGFQLARIPEADRAGLKAWLEELEFNVLGIPKPDCVFYLDVQVETAQALVDQKGPRSYTDKKRDVYEADTDYLKEVQRIYTQLCREESNFTHIQCIERSQLRSITSIHDEIYDHVLTQLNTQQ